MNKLENFDIYSAIASRIFNIPLEKVNKEQRRYAKTIYYYSLYSNYP